jgi:predicted MFS family arabinose efflux permease
MSTLNNVDNDIDKKSFFKKTRFALYLSNIIKEPLFCMYNITPFILGTQFLASPFVLAILTAIRPGFTFVAYFWGNGAKGGAKNLRRSVLLSSFLSCVLFLFIPFFNSMWLVIISSAFYMIFHRASIPAWMETLKLNIEKEKRAKLFANASSLAFFIGVILSLYFSPKFKENANLYKYFYFFSGLIGMLNLWVLAKVPINSNKEYVKPKPFSIKEKLIDPLKESFELLKNRKDFLKFHIGYTFAGAGILLIHPILPVYFKNLNITLTEITTALLIFKGLGSIISSPIWGRFLAKKSIMKLSFYMSFLAFISFIILFFTQVHIYFLYTSYFIYGVSVAGSHVLWSLSGPAFSKNDSSVHYSSLNFFILSLRGIAAPFIGSMLAIHFSPSIIISLGALSCLYGGIIMLTHREKQVALN